MLYSSQAVELRAFLRDQLGFNATDVGGGWLIMALPEADMGVHPSDESGVHGAPSGTHAISFYCDDILETIKDLEARGVVFTDGVSDRGYGLTAHFKVPGGFELELYQPLYRK